MSEAGPRVNGPASPTGKYIDGIDPDDPAYIKNLQRPAEVKEDLQQMENRSRVSVILNSQAFKDELEQVVEEQLRNGPYPASLIALQQITDLLLPQSTGNLGSLARASSVIPINDLRGVESFSFVKGEKLLRCKVASLYRLVELCGWSHGIHNHISARVSPESENFLLNPFGLTYSEITASSLVKVDVNGDIVEPGSTHLGVYKAGFSVHSAIHQARPDIKCIVHLHTPSAVAVSALKCGLLAMSQEALVCGNVSYHDFHGVAVDAEERERLARNLGVHNKILILRNRGVLACGETVEEAFHFTFNVMAACEAQVKAMPVGLDNIVIPSAAAREQTHRVANQGGGGVDSTGRKWKIGELEFEALMRTLDNSGFRTGHVYKMPIVKQEKKERSNSEVEIPPASSSFTYIFDGDYEHSKYVSPVKAAMERQKKAYKAGWLTTPNTYKKTEVAEIGTTTPKKITKWVPETDSPNRPGGAILKIESPNQFAPQGENPKEFKEKQKSIKKDYYEERITAGPQSRILEGITWDEAQRAKDGQLSGAGDQLIVVGAASKGIIQRDHQHNAVVYRQYYAANPFENMSEAEIDAYQAEVQRRERGELETSTEEEIQPPVVEVPREAPPTQRPPEPEIQEPEVRYTRGYDNSSDTPVTSRPRQSQGYSVHEEVMLAQLAETVVQSVIHDALAAAHQGKGQQILIGAGPLHKHHFLDHLCVGSQIISDHRNISTHCQPIQSVDSCSGFSNDKCSDCHSSVRTLTNIFNRINHTFGTGHGESTGLAAEQICLETGDSCLHSQKHENLRQLSSGHVKGGSYLSYARSTMRCKDETVDICRGGPNEEVSTAMVSGSCRYFHTGSCSCEQQGTVGCSCEQQETAGCSCEQQGTAGCSCEQQGTAGCSCEQQGTAGCSCEQQGTAGCSCERSENPCLQYKKNVTQRTQTPATGEQQPSAQPPAGDISLSRTDMAINQRIVDSRPDRDINLPQSLPSTVCDVSVNLKHLKRKDMAALTKRKDMAALNKSDNVALSFDEDLSGTVLTTAAGAASYKNLLVIEDAPDLTYLPQGNVILAEEILFRSSIPEQGKCQPTLLQAWPFDDYSRQSMDSFRDNIKSVTELSNSVNRCKNQVDNVLLLDRIEGGVAGSSKNAFDSCSFMKSVGFLTMSRDSFSPPEIMVYPVSRVGMPPRQDTTNVQRTSEVGRPRQGTLHQSPNTSRTRRGGAREVSDSEGTASKQKWTPKSKNQRRQLDQSLEENVSVISEKTLREEKRLLERSFGRHGQQDMDPDENTLNALRCEEALRKAREEKRARRNEEARIIYEMRTGERFVSSSIIRDGLKKEAGNNQAHGHGNNKNDRDNEMSRADNKYRTHEDALRNEANIRKSTYYRQNERERRNNEMGGEPENNRSQEKLSEYRPGLEGDSHKYDLSDDDTETINIDGSQTKTLATDDSNIDDFSVIPKKTESSDKLIKELKDKIEDRKSRMLEKTRDVEADRLVVVEKVDIMKEKLLVTAGVSVSQMGSVTAPTQIQGTADVENSDNVSDDTSLEKRGDDKGRSHREDEMGGRSGGRYRDKSGERDRRKERQDGDEKRDRDRYRRRSVDSERRGARQDEEEGVSDRYRDKERSKRRNQDYRDRYRENSEERGRREQRDEREIDRNHYRGRSGERERRRERRGEEEEEFDRDHNRGRSGERERRRRRDEEGEEMDRHSYRGRSGDRERRRGRRDEEEEMNRHRYRGRSGDRERRGRRDGEEEMDRDRYRGRSGDQERRGRRDEEEEMDKDRYRGRSGDRERRGRRDEEEEMGRDRYRGRSADGERRRGRRDNEEEEIDRESYRGRSGERERRRRRDDEEGIASDRQRGKSAEIERRRKQVYEEEGKVRDQYTGKNEDKYRQKGRRDEDTVTSDIERRKKDGQLDESVDISVDSKEILKLDESLRDSGDHQIETTGGRKTERERDKGQKSPERKPNKGEDKSRGSRNRDDLSKDVIPASQVKVGSREETKGMESEPPGHKPAEKANVDIVTESLSKLSQDLVSVSRPVDETMAGSIRVAAENRILDSSQRKKKEQTKSEWRITPEEDKRKPKEKKSDDSVESAKELVQSSKIPVLQPTGASQVRSKHSRRSADSSPHVSDSRPSRSDVISRQFALNTNLPVTEPLEIFQSKHNKADDLQQAAHKGSAMIVTDLDEGFDSVPQLAVRDLKTDIGLHGTDRIRAHEDGKSKKPVNDYETTYITSETVKTDLGVLKTNTEKMSARYNKYSKDIGLQGTDRIRAHEDEMKKPVNDYETRYITSETVKTDLGVLKTSTEKMSARYNKYSKDIGKDRKEKSLDSTGYRQKLTDLEIPEISIKKDYISDIHKVTEKEIPEILSMKNKSGNRQRITDVEIPEISIKKDYIDDIHKLTEKEIPEILSMSDKSGNRQRITDLEIPEISIKKNYKDDRHKFTEKEIPEIVSMKDKHGNRQNYRGREIPEISIKSKAIEKEIPEIPSLKEKSRNKQRYKDKEIPEMSVQKDNIDDEHKATEKEIPEILSLKDKSRNKQRYRDKEIPEMSVKKDNIDDAHKVTEKEIPEILSMKDTSGSKQKYRDKEIPEISLTKIKDNRYWDVEIPEMSVTKDKTERGHRYTSIESPETKSLIDKTKDRQKYTKKDISEIQYAYPPVKEPVESFLSADTRSDILQHTSHKGSAVIVTDLDEGFDSVPHLAVEEDLKTVIGLQGTDHIRAHEDKMKKPVNDYETAYITSETVKTDLGVLKTSTEKMSAGYNKYSKDIGLHGTDRFRANEDKMKKPVNDYETAYITSETVKTDLGVLKTSTEKMSARYNKYSKDIGKDRQERSLDSTGYRQKIRDLEIPEISVKMDNVDVKHKVIEKEIPEILSMKDTSGNRQRYRDKEIPEMSAKTDTTAKRKKHQEFPEVASAHVKTAALEVLKASGAKVRSRAPRAVPEDESGDEQVDKKMSRETDIDQEVQVGRTNKRDLVGVKTVNSRTSELGVNKDTKVIVGIVSEAGVKSDTNKEAFDAEVYKQIKARSLAYKENPSKSHTSQANIGSDTSKGGTKSPEYREDRSRPSTYTEKLPISDIYKDDSKQSDIYKDDSKRSDTYKDDSKRSDTYKDDSKRSDIYKDDSKRSDTYKDDSKRSDTYKDDSKRSDTYKDDSKRSDIYKDDSKRSDTYKDDSKRSDTYKDDSKRSDTYKDDSKRSDTYKDDSKRSDTYKDDSKRSDTYKDDSKRSDTYKDDSKRSDTYKDDSKRSDIYKDDSKRSDTYKDDSKRSDSYKDDSKRSDTYKDDSKRSDTYKDDSKRSDTYKDDSKRSDTYKDDSKRSGNYKDRARTNISTKDREQYDTYKEKNPLPLQDIAQPDVHTESRLKSDTHRDTRGRSDAHKVDRITDDDLQLKAKKDSRTTRGINKENVGKDNTNTEYDLKSDSTKQNQARLNEDKSRSKSSKEDRQRPDINSGDTIRFTDDTTEIIDLTAIVPTTYKGDAKRLVNEKVIKDADNKIQKRIKSDIHEFGSKLPEEISYRLVPELSPPTDKEPPTIQHSKSPEVQNGKTLDVHAAPATVAMTKPVKLAAVALTKPTTGELTRAATGELTRAATGELTRAATGELTRAATGELTRAATGELTRAATGDLTRAATGDLTRAATGELTRAATGKVSRPAEAVNMAVGRIPDSHITDNRQDVHKVERTSPSKILEDVGNKSPEQRDRKDDKTRFVKRSGARDLDEDKRNENRKDTAYKETSGRLSKIANESTSRLGRESEKFSADRDGGKLPDVSNLRAATVGDKKDVDKRNNWRDRSTDVALDSTVNTRGDVGKQFSARGDVNMSGVNVQDVSVEGNKGNVDTRFLKRNLSQELAAEAAAKAGNRTSKQLSPTSEHRESSPQMSSVSKDANESRRPNQNVRVRSTERVPETSVRSGREAERSYHARRNVRSLSPVDVFEDNESQQHKDSRTRPPNLVPRAGQARVGAAAAYPVRGNERRLLPEDVFDDNESQQHKDSRTRPPNLVPRAGQARVGAAAAYPVRRNERVVSAAEISNRDQRRPNQDNRTRSSQLSQEPPSNRSWRSASEADVPKEDKHFMDEKAKTSFPEADFAKSKQLRDSEDWNTFDDHELAEAVVRPQEKQKYAGFVKRTGRGGRKSLPLRGVSLEGDDRGIEKQQDDGLSEMEVEHKQDDTSQLASQKDEPSEGIIRDHFSTVVHENPIEVKVDNDDNPPQPSPKKGIFSFFGCVAGKSADFVRMLERSKKKRPTAYYEEGEKRKIKKLSKEKEKEEKKVLYFEKTEEASDSYDETDSSFRTSDGESPETTRESPPPLPVVEEKPLQAYRSVRYQKRPPPLQPIKPVSTFIDPSEGLEAIEDSASEEDEGSPTLAGRRKRLSDDDSPRAEQPVTVTLQRSESTKDPKFVEKLEQQLVERSKSERRPKLGAELREGKPSSPSKSDTIKSTDSASGGETLEERSSKEGSPTKEQPSPTKEKKKKKKFRIPSFSKKKSKENRESAI